MPTRRRGATGGKKGEREEGRERERERERESRAKAPRSSSAHPSSRRSRASPPAPPLATGRPARMTRPDSLSCILRIHRIIIMITTIMTTIIISPGRFGSAALTAGVGSLPSPPLSSPPTGTSQREGAAASASLAISASLIWN